MVLTLKLRPLEFSAKSAYRDFRLENGRLFKLKIATLRFAFLAILALNSSGFLSRDKKFRVCRGFSAKNPSVVNFSAKI